jgi:hypothetical protein
MIKFILIFILIMEILSCDSKKGKNREVDSQNKKTELEVIPKFKGSFFNPNNKDSSIYFIFDVILTNYTRSDIELWTLYCTPQANVLFDSDQYDFLIPRCSGNGPKLVRLSPNQQLLVPKNP